MRTAEQANLAIRAQLLAAELTPAMRVAVLSAQPTELDQPQWDDAADYCTGHESLRGDLMGASFFCEGPQVCHQAREAYKADREPDPDMLHIEQTDDVRVATIVAVMQRGICLDGRPGSDHRLTDLGHQVWLALKAQEGTR